MTHQLFAAAGELQNQKVTFVPGVLFRGGSANRQVVVIFGGDVVS